MLMYASVASQNTLHNKNFAVHFPLIDKLFGTYYLPENKWPDEMGLENEKFPKGYFKQLIFNGY